MGQYIAKRLLTAIPVLLVVSILIFGGVRVIPGNICFLYLGAQDNIDVTQCDRINHQLGLDKPVVTQYFNWMGKVLTGNLGTSMKTSTSVWGRIKSRLPATLELTILASVVSITLALPMGVYSALKQDKPADVLLRFFSITWLSMPSFWVGSMLITFPAIWWHYATPVPFIDFWKSPWTNIQQMYLPAISLGLALSATVTRLVRSSMLEVLRQDYVRTARAKGLRESVVLSKHALKNAMLPVITLIGIQLAFLLGGTVVIESLFALPGLGTLLVEGVLTKDFPLIQGIVLLFAVVIIVINLVVDLSYGLFDPRVRYA
jgi:peptide/nickel transport system permease protein